MKSLSIAFLVIGLIFAWAVFTPQVVNASPRLIGAGIMCGQPCSGDYVIPCSDRGCDGRNYLRCTGYGGPGTCVGWMHPCYGASYCFDIVSRGCF